MAEGEISFWQKVSSEGGFDVLEITIDGALTDSWSGDERWDRVSYPVSGGPHTFEWKYEKDSSVSEGDDTAWIDDVAVGPIP